MILNDAFEQLYQPGLPISRFPIMPEKSPLTFKVYPNVVILTDIHGNTEWLSLSLFPSSHNLIQEWVIHLFCAFQKLSTRTV